MKPSTGLPVRFYRIIDRYVLCNHKLRMPDGFVQKYGGELSNFVRLKVPAGDIWHIGVEKEGKWLLLHDGWQKFMEHYSVGPGSFLIFKYEGNSNFHVHICDLTATEIQYPFTTNARRPNHTIASSGHEKEEFGVDNDEFMVDSPLLSPMLTYLDLNALHENRANKVQGGKATMAATNPHIDRTFPEHVVEGTRGRKKASLALTSKSDKPSFTVTMKTYNVKTSFVVLIPSEFVEECPLNNIDCIKLQDSDGRKWPVGCLRKSGKPKWLSKGWKSFAEAKKLVTGDVCVFELIQEDEAVFKFSVFRAKNKQAKLAEPQSDK